MTTRGQARFPIWAIILTAGVIVGAGIATPGAAAGATALGSPGSANAGVLAKATALFGGSKIGLATVVVVATAVPVATYVATDIGAQDQRPAVAGDARVQKSALPPAQTPEEGIVMPESLVPPPPESVPAPTAVPRAKARALASAAPAQQRNPERASDRPPAAAASSVAVFPALENRSPESTLREETELVDWALSALRSGDTAGARALLQEHAQRFPSGVLVRERERALERVRHAEASNGKK